MIGHVPDARRHPAPARSPAIGVRFRYARAVAHIPEAPEPTCVTATRSVAFAGRAARDTLTAGLAAPAVPAHAAVTPSSGGPHAAFDVTFPAMRIQLDL